MMDSISVLAGNLLASTYTAGSQPLAVACPTSRPDLYNKINPAVDTVVGNIIGLKPIIITVVIGLVVLLVICAASEKARSKIGGALGWIVGLALVGSAIIAILASLIDTGC